MNTKRQTVWLVSMLSLMVVLSAYYLFTQDLGDADKLTDSGQPGQNVTEVTGSETDLVINEVTLPGDSVLDKKVLEQLEKEGIVSGGLFSELLAKRAQTYADEENRIWAVISNVQNKQELSAAAFTELSQLEDKNSRITNLESELMKTYEMALIAEENDHYKVVVASDKLARKEAASIIEQVMSVMELKPNQVSVQFVPQG